MMIIYFVVACILHQSKIFLLITAVRERIVGTIYVNRLPDNGVVI